MHQSINSQSDRQYKNDCRFSKFKATFILICMHKCADDEV